MARLLIPLLLILNIALANAAPAKPAFELVSAEFGTFDASNPKQAVFDPGNIVPHREGQRYGWIIELRTRQRTLSVQEEYILPSRDKDKPRDPLAESLGLKDEKRHQVSQRQLVPVDGKIYGEWAIGPQEPAGKRQLQVIIEGEIAARFEFEVR